MRPGSQLLIAHDDSSFYTKGAQLFLASVTEALNVRKFCAVVLSGGSTPKKLFQVLGDSYYKQRIPWNRIYFFWGDERCVPPDHPESNYKMAYDFLLFKVGVPEKNIFRMPGEISPPHDAARSYENALRTHFRGGFPRFDFNLMGVGEDGHTASLFPNTSALQERQKWVTTNYVEKLSSHRITLTVPVLNNSQRILFLVSGETKASVVKEIFREEESIRYPAQLIRAEQGELIWLLDRTAASKLPPQVHDQAVHL